MNDKDHVINYGLSDPLRSLARQKGPHMEATAIKQDQKPEVYIAADVESMSKGGYKKTIKCSVRVFDGDTSALYKHLEDALETGFAIANETIRQQEENDGKEGKRD